MCKFICARVHIIDLVVVVCAIDEQDLTPSLTEPEEENGAADDEPKLVTITARLLERRSLYNTNKILIAKNDLVHAGACPYFCLCMYAVASKLPKTSAFTRMYALRMGLRAA